VLDVALWLSPRLSIRDIYSSFISGMLEFMAVRPFSSQDVKTLTDSVEIFGRFNWLSWIRTFPVGVSSLEAFGMPDSLPLQTPFGLQEVIQISSAFNWFGWTVLLSTIGWILGSLYFRWVSVTALGREEAGISLFRAISQTILLSVIWVMGITVIILPISIILTIVTLISPALSNGILFVLLILSYWLIVPMFFMPHGIFVRKQNAVYSVFASLRMSRFTLPTSGMFVFSVILLARGLNFLWNVPAANSWMTLVGIAGHAFITTALLAASLVYYRDMNVWLQIVFEQMQQKQSVPTQPV
jgi:hypothetical protein